MQSLDVISVNIWHILISLANLVLLFLILKKFLFQPVKKLFAAREAALAHQYAAATAAEQQAKEHQEAWEAKLQGADAEADAIVKKATETAAYRATQIVEEANVRAKSITLHAQEEAELTRKKAEEGIRQEIIDVSAAIAEKMLQREVNEKDHRAMINSFIDQIGDSHDGDQ